jgi:hypothetical protein
MNYVEQQARDTTYAVFCEKEAKTFDSGKLRVIKRGYIDIRSSIHIEAAIIGESHFVRIKKNGRLILVEMLACVDLERIGFIPSLSQTLKWNPEGFTSVWQDPNFSLKGKVKVLLPRKQKTRLPKEARKMIHLLELFPGPKSPATEVGISVEGTNVLISTIHEYVLEDGRIEPIITQTNIDLS